MHACVKAVRQSTCTLNVWAINHLLNHVVVGGGLLAEPGEDALFDAVVVLAVCAASLMHDIAHAHMTVAHDLQGNLQGSK